MEVDAKGGKYEGLTRERLIQLLDKRDRQKKLGLVWERDEIEADRAVDANFVTASLDQTLSEGAAPWQIRDRFWMKRYGPSRRCA
jgi:adenine-specific DNA-methyltransferase